MTWQKFSKYTVSVEVRKFIESSNFYIMLVKSGIK